MEQQPYLSSEQFDELKAQELHFINKQCDKTRNRPGTLTGLSLSGGGIRSAVFNLGVLQALANRGLLQKIDYLSTVSGGGYIGSSLTWFLSPHTQKDFAAHYSDPKQDQSKESTFGTCKNNFPYGTDKPGHLATGKNSKLQQNLVEYIRRRGNYLTPGENYTLLTLLAVALRTGMLSLMTWVPLISLIMFGLMNVASSKIGTIPVAFNVMGNLGIMAILGFSVWGVSMAFIISLSTSKGKDDESFKYRLRADKYSNLLLNLAFVLIGIYLIAWLGTKFSARIISNFSNTLEIFNEATYMISIFLMLMGIVAGLIALFRPDSPLVNKILLPATSALLALGILLCAYQLAYAATHKLQFNVVDITFRWDYLLYSGIAIALFLCVRTNLNVISIARFYRDRLKETFMPDAVSSEPDSPQNFSKEAYLKDMCQAFGTKPYQGPYHIINANVILVDSKQKKYSRRGGDNFMLSPLYCGSKATGWRKTSNYFKGELTLATAMAISGAAVNPHSGVGGQGVTRNQVVSFVLGILNLRLGAWFPNPNPQKKFGYFFHPGNFLQSAWYAIKSLTAHRGYHENAACVQVSDGGHFENLGVYELIRRELDLIIVSDASADPAFTFADFRNALRLAEADLQVEISLGNQEKLSNIMPNQGKHMDLPIAEAHKGFLCATIRYKNNKKKGRLIYLKSTMIGGQSIRTKSYKLEHSRFPDQPTSDQFFDEPQFDAYHDLGYTIAFDMLKNCDLTPLESRNDKQRRSDIERRKNDLGFKAGNRRQLQRRTRVRRVA